MKIGVVGLPNVGKSTLFNALTRNRAPSANYPFCTIEPNVGIVTVADERVDWLAEHYKSKSVIHATIEFVDIAGLVKGAASGEGLGNKFLGNIRESDAILHVVRAFDRSEIIHVAGSVDPIRDIETINLELILADLESVTKQYERASKGHKEQESAKRQAAAEQADVLGKIKKTLEAGINARATELNSKEFDIAKGLHLITMKPVIYAANGDDPKHLKAIQEYAARNGASVITIDAKVEEELSQLDSREEAQELMELYGMTESGLDKLIKAGYELLSLVSFLTAGEQEVRAWTIRRGTRAPGAAGRIHTDFERGFIRAEVVSFDDFKANGTIAKAKELGKVRSEGKDYTMQDGDVVLFKFNV